MPWYFRRLDSRDATTSRHRRTAKSPRSSFQRLSSRPIYFPPVGSPGPAIKHERTFTLTVRCVRDRACICIRARCKPECRCVHRWALVAPLATPLSVYTLNKCIQRRCRRAARLAWVFSMRGPVPTYIPPSRNPVNAGTHKGVHCTPCLVVVLVVPVAPAD